MSELPDENTPELECANIVNDILLAHRDKWKGDDEIQYMLVEAFVRGVAYWQEQVGTEDLRPKS